MPLLRLSLRGDAFRNFNSNHLEMQTLKIPWPSPPTPRDSFQTSLSYLLILVTLTQGSQGLSFHYLPWDLSANPKSQRGTISSPSSAEIQALCSPASHSSHNPERACVHLGFDRAVGQRVRPMLQTISYIFPPSWCIAILFLGSGWMSKVWFALVWKTLCKCKIVLLDPSLTY